MYINYVNDRNELGYECLMDTQCGNGLVLITDSTFVFVKDVASTAKGKTKKLIVVFVVTLAVASGLRDINPESGKTFVNNSNNQQVILVKAEGNPVTPPTNRGPSNKICNGNFELGFFTESTFKNWNVKNVSSTIVHL